jgi:hypothetical protein
MGFDFSKKINNKLRKKLDKQANIQIEQTARINKKQ